MARTNVENEINKINELIDKQKEKIEKENALLEKSILVVAQKKEHLKTLAKKLDDYETEKTKLMNKDMLNFLIQYKISKEELVESFPEKVKQLEIKENTAKKDISKAKSKPKKVDEIENNLENNLFDTLENVNYQEENQNNQDDNQNNVMEVENVQI